VWGSRVWCGETTAIQLTHRARGRALKDGTVRKAIDLAEGEDCSVGAGLHVQVLVICAIEVKDDPPARRPEPADMVSS
jgi:hypothetical protein